jgi:transposase-like protein
MGKTTKYRKRWSTAETEELVAKWRASGLSVREFSRRQEVSASCMYRWIGGRRTTGGQRTSSSPPKMRRRTGAEAAFTSVEVVDAGGRGPTITVSTPGGHTVTVEGEWVSAEVVKMVLEGVAGC